MPDLKKWQQDGKNAVLLACLQRDLKKLKNIKYHYLRKENSLYNFLVKYGLVSDDTSSFLWGIEDEIRTMVKNTAALLEKDPLPDKYVIEAKVEKVASAVMEMIFKENTIFLPILSIILTPDDWYMVKQDELEVGYCLIKQPPSWHPSDEERDEFKWEQNNGGQLNSETRSAYRKFLKRYRQPENRVYADTPVEPLRGDESYPVGNEDNSPDLVLKNVGDMTLKLEIGSLSLKEIPAIFNVLPIDLTFVNKYDRVKWFSNSDRTFPRTRSVIGRPVIRCHPPRSIDKVMEILQDFHQGLADSEDFWVDVHGRTIYLCFYAVRDKDDNYLGCLEVVQDITRFKDITGQKTLENKDQFEKRYHDQKK
ncbi:MULTISPECIES: PAS domain-containing protein [Lactobacillus]|uniref:PAS domain-containing protein n=1 Tax=Lactobacillus TaxID=1578 RepID=UPI0013748122|nr:MULTISPECIES: PAS domain-containing protein [Lactobacillus]